MTINAIILANDFDVHTATADESVADVTARLAEKRIGALPVIDGAQVVGIFSERDIVYGVARLGAAFLNKKVGEVMTSPAITVDPNTPILSALSLMTKRRIRHLPVTADGVLLGFVSIGDLVKFRIEHIESEAAAMRDYIQMA